jgi:hypothetical protein
MSPNAGGGGSYGVSANEYSRTAQINFGDLTPYLTYEKFSQVLFPSIDSLGVLYTIKLFAAIF